MDSYINEIEQTVAFVIYYDEERCLEECIYYIGKLQVPLGISVEIVRIKGKTEFAECCLEAEEKSDAVYKVYLDQHTFIIHDLFLYDLLAEFRKNPRIDAIGILGGDEPESISHGRVLLWDEEGIAEVNHQESIGTVQVHEVNHMLVAFHHLAGGGQKEKGAYAYAVIPCQRNSWCIYDCGNMELSAEEEEYRFMVRRAETYREVTAVRAVERLLKNGQLAYKDHIEYVERAAVGKGSIAAYFWEDSLLINSKREKYLRANGRVFFEGRAQNEMHVAVSFNHRYAVYAAVMLQSLYDNHPLCNIHVHVLQTELTMEDKRGLEKQAKRSENIISFYDIDKALLPKEILVTQEWSIEAYFRLFMFEVLPGEIERILYLDVDIIVNKPVYDLYFMDMKGYDIVGCRDFSMVLREDFPDKRKELFASVKEDKDFVYINSGMMLIDLSRLRGRICAEDYWKVIRKQGGRLLAPDQDVINLVHWRQTGLVDEYRYDFFNACLKGVKVEEVKQYVSIIHYAGPKPWMVSDIDIHAHRIWWEYAVKTDMAKELVYETICSEKRLISEQRKAMEQMKYCRHVPFMSCEADGIKYIGSSLDFTIMRRMYNTGENWSKKEIDIFFELTKAFYGYGADEAEGIFLDVGGNIGTTSIYVNKVKAPQLKVIAFEPIRDNIRVFKANCALNDIAEDKVILVERAVSNKAVINTMERNIFNPGMSCVVQEGSLKSTNTERVESVSLDSYLELSGIKSEEIRYLWIDAEGYEGYVIGGAKKMFEGTRIPVMMEFVPQYLKKQNCYEMLINDLSMFYSYFIWLEEFEAGGAVRLRGMDTLNAFGEELGERQADIFLVKG